jgi:hypothetical protein
VAFFIIIWLLLPFLPGSNFVAGVIELCLRIISVTGAVNLLGPSRA